MPAGEALACPVRAPLSHDPAGVPEQGLPYAMKLELIVWKCGPDSVATSDRQTVVGVRTRVSVSRGHTSGRQDRIADQGEPHPWMPTPKQPATASPP